MKRLPNIELTRDQLILWIQRAATDTGFVCREILGYNYDLDMKGRRANEGQGGVRDDEPFRKMCEFVQRLEGKRLRLLLAPRGSLKSSICTGDSWRRLFADPDHGHLWMSGTDTQVRKRSLAIRNAFEFNPYVSQLWGYRDHKEVRGKPWTIDQWTLARRSDFSKDVPTMSTGSLKRVPTGGHYNAIYLDDLIDFRNCKTPEQLEMAKFILSMIQPLMLPGTVIVMDGTRYNPEDVYSYAERQSGWDRLIIGAGVELQETSDGLFRVTGKPLYPHLTLEYLQDKIDGGMTPEDFASQYLNEHIYTTLSQFKREWFQPIPWDAKMRDLTGWLLTDTATSTAKGSCMSSLLYVGIDQARRVYLLDACIGRMEPGVVVEELFAMIERWQGRVNHGGITMEKVTAAQVYKSWIDIECRRRGLRINLREIGRAGGEQAKDRRISRMQPKFRARDVFVVDTFPKYYRDSGKQKILWDPAGHIDPKTQMRLPDGELVMEFVAHPHYPFKDIADSFADIDYVSPSGEVACYFRRVQRPNYSLQRMPGSVRAVDRAGLPSGDFLKRLGRAPTTR